MDSLDKGKRLEGYRGELFSTTCGSVNPTNSSSFTPFLKDPASAVRAQTAFSLSSLIR